MDPLPCNGWFPDKTLTMWGCLELHVSGKADGSRAASSFVPPETGAVVGALGKPKSMCVPITMGFVVP